MKDDNTYVKITQNIINATYYHSSLTDTYLSTSINIIKDANKYYFYKVNNQPHYFSMNNLTNVNRYYLVQDYLGNYYYINAENIGVYPELSYNPEDSDESGVIYEYKNQEPKQYLYINQNFEQIKKILVRKESFVSTNKYSLFGGEYYSKIITNLTSNKFIALSENSDGINLINSSGGIISINSESNIFKMKIGSKYQFGFEMDKEIQNNKLISSFENEEILGKFTIDNSKQIGLFMTSSWTGLTSNSKMILTTPQNIKAVVTSQGGSGGNDYSITNPQIILVAGGNKDGIKKNTGSPSSGTASELILNSSVNG
jgi:hypothetical protein